MSRGKFSDGLERIRLHECVSYSTGGRQLLSDIVDFGTTDWRHQLFQPLEENSLVIKPDSLFTTTLSGVACCIDSPFPLVRKPICFCFAFLGPKALQRVSARYLFRIIHISCSIESVHVNQCL